MCSLYLMFVTMTTAVLGCSPPEGGYVPPTPAEKVFYSEYVVKGEVKSISPEDPLYGNMGTNTTYSASVFVQCSYKGKPLPGMITIGGAGFVPGHCTAKDVEMKKYVLFLSAAKTQNNETIYEQTEVAEPYYEIRNYLDVCGVQMVYPEEYGMILKRKICPYEKEEGPCKYYDQKTGQTKTRTLETSSPPSQVRKSTENKEFVSVNIGRNVQSTTEKNGNGSSGLNATVGLLLLSFLSILY